MDLLECSVVGVLGCLGEDVCYGGIWVGDYVLNVILMGFFLKVWGKCCW